jgi:hypothetical protein
MEPELSVCIEQANCKHDAQRKYEQRSFDILNGFEIIAVKCCSCDKTLELKIKKL